MKLYSKELSNFDSLDDNEVILLKDTPKDFQEEFKGSDRKSVYLDNVYYRLSQIFYYPTMETYVYHSNKDKKIKIVLEK